MSPNCSCTPHGGSHAANRFDSGWRDDQTVAHRHVLVLVTSGSGWRRTVDSCRGCGTARATVIARSYGANERLSVGTRDAAVPDEYYTVRVRALRGERTGHRGIPHLESPSHSNSMITPATARLHGTFQSVGARDATGTIQTSTCTVTG